MLEGNGWILKDGKCQIEWYDGDQVPRVLGQVLGYDVLDDDNEADLEYDDNEADQSDFWMHMD